MQCLHSDMKCNLQDLGTGPYADKHCYNLGKLPHGSLVGGLLLNASSKSRKKGRRGRPAKANAVNGNFDKGIMFAMYNTLIRKSYGGTCLGQLIEHERHYSYIDCIRSLAWPHILC